jgi:hypothetical protein
MPDRNLRGGRRAERGFTFASFVIILSIIGICTLCIQNEIYTYARTLKKATAAARAQAAFIAAQAFVRDTIANGGTVDADTDWDTVLARYSIRVPVDGALRIWLNNARNDIELVQWQDGWERAKDIGGWHVIVADYPPGAYPRGYFEKAYGSEEAAASFEREKREKRLRRLEAAGAIMDDAVGKDTNNAGGKGQKKRKR